MTPEFLIFYLPNGTQYHAHFNAFRKHFSHLEIPNFRERFDEFFFLRQNLPEPDISEISPSQDNSGKQKVNFLGFLHEFPVLSTLILKYYEQQPMVCHPGWRDLTLEYNEVRQELNEAFGLDLAFLE